MFDDRPFFFVFVIIIFFISFFLSLVHAFFQVPAPERSVVYVHKGIIIAPSPPLGMSLGYIAPPPAVDFGVTSGSDVGGSNLC